MADRVRYIEDRTGTRELMNSIRMLELLTRRAEDGMAFAIGVSPERTGHYKESFRVVPAEPHRGPERNRGEARIVNDASYAVDVEFHNGSRVLGKTVDYVESR